MTSTYSIPNVNNKPPQIVDSGIYADIRLDPDSSQPNYIGLNLVSNQSQDSTDWKIYKIFWSSTNIIEIRMAYGAWSNRVSLF